MSKAPVRKTAAHIRQVEDRVDGKWFARTKVICHGCFAEATFPRIPPNIYGKYLEQRGYRNPTSAKAIRCPACVTAEQAALAQAATVKSETRAAKADQPKEPTMPQAEAPRIATREDNRKIYEALETFYDPKGGGYLENHSDKSLSEKLLVPRAWVGEVRDRYFGPDVSVAKLTAIADLDEANVRLKAVVDQCMNVAAAAEDEIRRNVALRGNISKAVA